MFVSFEGIDGSGKSTQARLLAEALRSRGREVVEVREPGGTDLGERVRALLLDPGLGVASRAELLLFSAARAQLVAEVIVPALDRGAMVIADRFFDSSTAYQGAGRGLDAEWMQTLHQFATGGVAPSRTYFVDLAPEAARARRAGRAQDRVEQAGAEFYARVAEAYREIAARTPRVVTLDGTLSVGTLHDRILADALAIH